jgi:hypothetical protein
MFGLSIFVIALNAHSAGLNELIQQNVKDSTRSYDQVLRQTAPERPAPRLWIHVRSKEQKNAVTGIRDWLEQIEIKGHKLDLRPIQLVESGPKDSDLRFFKKQDRETAEALFADLKKVIPSLELKDLSSQYRSVDFIKPGHYELWLSPDINTLTAPM